MLSFTCTKFANEVVWVAKKNDWILNLSYKLQRSRMLFHKLEICSFSKTLLQSVPFPGSKMRFDPPPYLKQHYGLNGTLTNLLPTVLVPVRSVQCRVYNGYLRVGPGRGKFYQDILQPGRKHYNMAGRSGIGVLVTGFSRVGALKKHAPLVFTSYLKSSKSLFPLLICNVAA